MQQWCCSSLVTACQCLARVKPQRLLPLHSMAPRKVHGHHNSANTYTSSIHQAASAGSKQIINRHFHSQHADQSVCKLLSTLRSHLQQQCRVNSSVSGSHSLHVPFKTLAYSTQCTTQSAASSVARLRAIKCPRQWRQPAASVAAKHSSEIRPAPNLKVMLFHTQYQSHTPRPRVYREGAAFVPSIKPHEPKCKLADFAQSSLLWHCCTKL